MIQPINNVLLTLDRALQDEILIEGGLKLYLDPTYQVEWHSTVTGIVAGIPKHPTGLCKDVCEKLRIGDEIAFSYRVVSDRRYPKVEDYFSPMFEPLPERKEFRNSKGDSIKVVAMPAVHGKFNKIWVGFLTDRLGNHIDGCQGNEHEVDNWLSKFKFSGVQDMYFNNLLNVKKNEYWRCAFTEILAKKDSKGRIKAINDRVICEPIEEDKKYLWEIENGISLPYQDLKIRYVDRAKLISGGIEMGYREGDIIGFSPNYIEKYDLFGKKYYLIKKKHIIGKWQAGT